MPARNEEATIRDAINCILAQTYCGPIRLLIALAPSNDRTRENCEAIARNDPRVRIVDNPQGITPVGLNLAIGASSAPYVARVDGHALVPENYLDHLMRTHLTSEYACVGPRLHTIGDGLTGRGIAFAMSARAAVGNAQFRSGRASGVVDTVAFGIYRRDWLTTTGAFNEGLIRNQDDEYHDRIRRIGGRIYMDSTVHVKYVCRPSYSALWQQYFTYGQWRVISSFDFGQRIKARHAAPAILVGTLGTSLVVAFWRPWPLALVAGTYLGALALVSAESRSARASVPEAALAGVAALVMQSSYGVGFLTQAAKRLRGRIRAGKHDGNR